ncbi:hypothetical protein A0256_00790 [Mucilaginibacter sp. PAMC 26640]|nr:hypothetical protein A0256_00790 [Mucilaginibacter sp. PAMC 26640]
MIHHSDRGLQFCSQNYTALSKEDRIAINMTQSGSPYENALAERIKGITETEFLLKRFNRTIRRQRKASQRSLAITTNGALTPV